MYLFREKYIHIDIDIDIDIDMDIGLHSDQHHAEVDWRYDHIRTIDNIYRIRNMRPYYW